MKRWSAGNGTFQFVVTDLLPGTWQILKDGKIFKPAITASGDEKSLHFTGTEGSYRFLR